MKDLITNLPDELLQLILLNVTTRESIRTSVLSTRWRNLWKRVQGLHLIGDLYTNLDVQNSLDGFLNSHKEESSPIYQFTLMCNEEDHDSVRSWLDFFIYKVVTSGVQCFAVDGHMYEGFFNLPTSFFKCETLIHLCLECVNLVGFSDCELFSLPHLETLFLNYVTIHSDVYLEILISGCPVLKVLTIRNTSLQSLTVRSKSLKRLSLRKYIYPNGYMSSSDAKDCRVLIDAPSLEFLCIQDVPLRYFKLENVSSSIRLCIDVSTYWEESHKFFSSVSDIKDLTISCNTLKGMYPLYFYFQPHFNPQQLPTFKNLTHLNCCFDSDISRMLPQYLSSCPNLKYLDLGLNGYPNTKEMASLPVPQCFQTSLEYIEIKMTPKAGQMRSRTVEADFANYILKNATILKKLTLWLDGEEDEYSRSVLHRRFPNGSLLVVKIGQLPAKFRRDYGFEMKPFFDPTTLISSIHD